MKNRNVKTLDLEYLKILKFSVSKFWICCVFYYEKFMYQKLHKFMMQIFLYELFSFYAESV
jgi:hypothetical protein